MGEIIRRLIETDPRFVRLFDLSARLDSTRHLLELRREMEAAFLKAETLVDLADALQVAERFGREARAAE